MSVKKDVKKKEKKVSINLHLSMKKFKFALNEAKEFLYSFFFCRFENTVSILFFFFADTESSGLAVLLLLDVPLASESGR